MSMRDLPEFIGPYRVLRPIAKGGMSEVLEVEDSFSGECFALKWLTRGGRARKRFDREYEAMIRLNHPSVVRVYHYGIQDQRPWMTMELVEGQPVQRYAKSLGRAGTPERTNTLLQVARQMALALDHVHRRGLIHRDLKSANVLVLPDGRVKLIDFGTAKIEHPMEAITGDGEFVGTYAYASPEQLRGKPLSYRSDIYNLGVLFYRMFTGKLPFYGDGIYDIARQHVEVIPKAPIERAPGLPAGISDLIMRMLEKLPKRRPRSMAALVEALDQLVDESQTSSILTELSVASDRLTGRSSQLVVAEEFIAAREAGSMLAIVGARGCGRRAFERRVRERAGDEEGDVVDATFRREMPPLMTMAELMLSVGRRITVSDQTALTDTLAALEQAESWTSVSLIEVLGPLTTWLKEHNGFLFLRNVHLADLASWEVIWWLQESMRAEAIPWAFVVDGLSWLGTRRALPRRVLRESRVVELGPLDVLRLGAYVASLLNRRPPPLYFTKQLHAVTGGWPRYVEQKLRSWMADGVLVVDGRDANRVAWDRLTEQRITPVPGYRDALKQGLAFLSEEEGSVLGLNAMCSRALSFEEISNILQSDLKTVEAVARRLHLSGWLHRDQQSVRCHDSQVAALAIESLSTQQVAEFGEALWRQDALRASLRIRWLLSQGQQAKALEYAAEVLESLHGREAPISALSVIEDSIEDIRELSPDLGEVRDRLWLAYVRCVLAVRPSDGVARQLFSSLNSTEGPAETEDIVRGYVSAELLGVIGHYPAYKSRLERAWEAHNEHLPSVSLLLVGMKLAWVEAQFGELEKAAEWHAALRSVVARLGRKSARAMATQLKAELSFATGRFDAGAALAAKAMDALEGIDGVSTRASVLPAYVDSLRVQGRYSEALLHLSEALASARATEMPRLVVPLLLAAARCEVELFRLGRAQEYVDELMASLRPGEYLHLRLEATLLWGRILVASGEYHHAEGVLQDTALRAKSAGLCVVEAHSNALLGQVDCFLGRIELGDQRMEGAVRSLVNRSLLAAALDACVTWSRARGATLDPTMIFEPVAQLFEEKMAVVPRLERLIARRRFEGSSVELDQEINDVLSLVIKHSSGMERSALRVHPWSRVVRRHEMF